MLILHGKYKEMKKIIANVVTNNSRIDFAFGFNKCRSLEETDTSLPTLIIGYQLAKKEIKDFNILKKFYENEKIWWTFLKTERRVDYDRDIINFSEYVLRNLVEDVEYSLIDVVNFTKDEIKEKIDYLYSPNNKLIYNYYGKFLFIKDENKAIVYGLPLTTCRYLGVDTDKFLKKLKSLQNNKFIYDINDIPIDIRRIFGSNTHYLLALYDYFS